MPVKMHVRSHQFGRQLVYVKKNQPTMLAVILIRHAKMGQNH